MPFAWITLAFVLGIASASQAGGNQLFWWAGFAAAALVGVGFLVIKKIPFQPYLRWRLPGTQLPVCLLPAIAILGGCLYLTAQPTHTPDRLNFYNDSGQIVRMEAVVSEPPELRVNSTLAVLRVTRFNVEGVDHPGEERVMALLPANTPLNYGDQLTIFAKPETPFENDEFSYRQYLATRGIFTVISYPRIVSQMVAEKPSLLGWLYNLRNHSIAILRQIFPAPESGLITGILLGPRNDISEETYEAFKASGTSHIIAISGFNIAILAALISTLCLSIFGKWRGAGIAIIIIGVYCVMVGGSASVVRAGIMGSLAILAGLIGRKQAGVNTLALTAFSMLIFNPMLVWDVGFQLSFFATLGLVWYAGPLTTWFKGAATRFIPDNYLNKTVDWIGEYFLFTLAAQFTTLPLLAYHFQRVPLASLLANPLVLPAQPPLMIGSGLALLAGWIWLPLGKAVAAVTVPFSNYTIRIVEWTAGLRLWEWRPDAIPLLVIIAFYLLMAVLMYVPAWRLWLKQRLSSGAILFGVTLITMVIWQLSADLPDGRLHVTFAGGAAEGAVLIQSPTGRYVLINGGQDRNALLAFTGQRLPRFASALDQVLVAPVKSTNVQALPGAVGQLQPAVVSFIGPARDFKSVHDLTKEAIKLSIPMTELNMGDSLDLGDGARLEVIEAGDSGTLLQLSRQSFRLAFKMGKASSASKTEGVYYFTDIDSEDQQKTLPGSLIVYSSQGNPIPGSINLFEYQWLEIMTDGVHMWINGARK